MKHRRRALIPRSQRFSSGIISLHLVRICVSACSLLNWPCIAGDEVRFLWKRTRTPSTYCFLLNRYLAFFGYITIAVFTFTVPDSVRETSSIYLLPVLMCLLVVGYPIPFHSIERSCSISRCKPINVFRQILLIMNQTIICGASSPRCAIPCRTTT